MFSIEQTLDAALKSFQRIPLDSVSARLRKMTAQFDEIAKLRKTKPAHQIFLFNCEIPLEKKLIEYVDVKFDQGNYDYHAVINLCIDYHLEKFPDLEIVLVTDGGYKRSQPHPRILAVDLEIDGAAPMYERVFAMASFVRSKLFNAPTVFLDTDAILAKPAGYVFQTKFDVAVTTREVPGLMPVNEGVIFACPGKGALQFFNAYVMTYEALTENSTIRDIYGDVKRWRGGQLSLNVVTRSLLSLANAPRIACLPCDYFNRTLESGEVVSPAEFIRIAVFHFKGGRKQMMGDVVAQLKRF